MFSQNKNQKSLRSFYIIWSIAGAVLFFGVFAFVLMSLVPYPHMITTKHEGKTRVDSELRFTFNLPVTRQIDMEITPKTFGEMRYQDMMIGDHFARTIVFQPEVTWLPETTYEVRVSNIKSSLRSPRAPKEFVYTFTTEAMPIIKYVTPEKDSLITPDAVWRITLDKANNQLTDYEFRLTPALDFQTELSQDKKTYTIMPARALSQGAKYSLDIGQKNVRYLFKTDDLARQEEAASVWQGSWSVQEAPGLISFEPQGSAVPLNSEIEVVFSENVDFDSFKDNVLIFPEINGEWKTVDYQTMRFKPQELIKETTYAVTLKAGLKTYNGGWLEEDSVHYFTTVGPVKMASSSPLNDSQGVGIYNSLRFTFNQAVDHDSAQSLFSISPQITGDFSWDDLAMIFKPKQAMPYNTTFTVNFGSGIKGVQGFNSEEIQSVAFATELSVTRLAVPFHRQEHNLSCEAASLFMALAFRNVNVSEDALIEAIGFEPTEKKDGVWGNPHIAFVGDIDGHQPSTGYGVYWQPISQAASKYRTARWFTGGKLSDITGEVKKGNPVIFWGTAGTGTRIDWKTISGDNVVAVSGEHARVVVGFIGPADNPTKIITLDPLAGEKYFTQAAFLANWAVLGNSGVVVE